MGGIWLEKMNIGYITKQDPNDKKAYSGTHVNMLQALRSNFEEVSILGPVDLKYKIIPKIKGRILRALSKKVYKYQYDTALAKKSARVIDRRIEMAKPDALLASLMSPEVAYLESKIPLYITTDATFPLLNEMYNSHSNLHPLSIKEALALEKRAFEKATKLILPLKWLADSAMKEYGVSSKKIEVIPYGCNLEHKLNSEEIDSVIRSRMEARQINLLFVGVRWEEKGGPFAVEVLRELLGLGLNAKLTIAGCTPQIPDLSSDVNIVGFLDKTVKAESERLTGLYKKASFFIMPTKAECVGMSFIEAASMALPAIGTNVGGVPEAIINNKSGFIIDKRTNPKEVAKWISKVWLDKDSYKEFSKEAFQRYSRNMNWGLWGERVKETILKSQ